MSLGGMQLQYEYEVSAAEEPEKNLSCSDCWRIFDCSIQSGRALCLLLLDFMEHSIYYCAVVDCTWSMTRYAVVDLCESEDQSGGVWGPFSVMMDKDLDQVVRSESDCRELSPIYSSFHIQVGLD